MLVHARELDLTNSAGVRFPSDTLTGVNDADYQPPFNFTGKIDKITLIINRPKLSPADEKMLMEKNQRNNKVSE